MLDAEWERGLQLLDEALMVSLAKLQLPSIVSKDWVHSTARGCKCMNANSAIDPCSYFSIIR